MKKIFTSFMLLLAIAAGTSLVSCKKAEKKLSAKEQANKIDATGEAFLAELDLDKWRATGDLVVPGIVFLDNADMDDADEPEVVNEESNVDVENLRWDRTYTIDMTNAKGHYTIDEKGKGAKVEGDFDDFQIVFDAPDTNDVVHNYVADITFTNCDKTFILDESKRVINEYRDADDRWIDCPGMVQYSKTIMKVPATMKIDFTVDNVQKFTAEGALSFSGYESLEETPVVKDLAVDVNLTVSAAGYTMNLSKFSIQDGSFNETFTFKHNKKQLLGITAKATGLDNVEKAGVKSDDGVGAEEEEDFPFACDNASVAVDVLGQVQVKGNIKFNNFYNKYLSLNNSKPKTVEETNALLKQLEPYYSLNLYYDGGSAVQANVKAKAFEKEDEGGKKYVDIAPVIFFSDGTSQAITEFFTAKNFAKTVKAVENFSEKISEYFESFEPKADSANPLQ